MSKFEEPLKDVQDLIDRLTAAKDYLEELRTDQICTEIIEEHVDRIRIINQGVWLVLRGPKPGESWTDLKEIRRMLAEQGFEFDGILDQKTWEPLEEQYRHHTHPNREHLRVTINIEPDKSHCTRVKIGEYLKPVYEWRCIDPTAEENNPS